jgi:hypothetical protein
VKKKKRKFFLRKKKVFKKVFSDNEQIIIHLKHIHLPRICVRTKYGVFYTNDFAV